jgi:hypothetical protein
MKNFFEIFRQFGHALSKTLASPGIGQYTLQGPSLLSWFIRFYAKFLNECNFTYAHKKWMFSATQIFTMLANS